MSKKIIISIVLVLVVIFGLGLAIKKNKQTDKSYELFNVQPTNLKQTVSATGNIKSVSEIDLKFENFGRVSLIKVKTGDQVKKGDLLAELDSSSYYARISQYQARVDKAKANLDKILNGAVQEDKNKLKANLDKTEADCEKQVIADEKLIANAENDLQTAEENLRLAEGRENSQIIKDAYDNALVLLFSLQTDVDSALNTIDNILGVDNKLANDSYEYVLGIKDSNTVDKAKIAYEIARDHRNSLKTDLNALNYNSSQEDIDIMLDKSEELLYKVKDALFKLNEVLENTLPVNNLSVTELDSLKASVQTSRASIANDYSLLVSQKQAIDQAKNSYSLYLIAYNKAKTNLDKIKAQAEQNKMSCQALVSRAQAEYNKIIEPARQEDIDQARASLKEAQAGLWQIYADLRKNRLIAPIDGEIGKIDIKVGEYISNQQAAIKLVNPHFKIEVDIPETDIVKIHYGDEAEVSLDAYGDEVKFKAIVTEIERGETVIQDVIYYKVSLDLQNIEDYEILNGMTANVVFFTEEKENVLAIPTRAIEYQNGHKYVQVFNPKQQNFIKTEIKTGLLDDSGLVEIISGLKNNDEILLD